MQGILRISEAVAIGIHASLALASNDGSRISGHELAQGMKASEAHLLKVMRLLGKAGIVASERGPSGGFSLAKDAGSVRLLDIYEAIEGSFPNGSCLFASPVCGGISCPMGAFICGINRQAMDYFTKTTLKQLFEMTDSKEARK